MGHASEGYCLPRSNHRRATSPAAVHPLRQLKIVRLPVFSLPRKRGINGVRPVLSVRAAEVVDKESSTVSAASDLFPPSPPCTLPRLLPTAIAAAAAAILTAGQPDSPPSSQPDHLPSL
jgi:hypothetical protein